VPIRKGEEGLSLNVNFKVSIIVGTEGVFNQERGRMRDEGDTRKQNIFTSRSHELCLFNMLVTQKEGF
jgi:hypothetical protein